jgi:hypothetical protein
MGCPKWGGVRLADVLKAAGVKPNGAHVAGPGRRPRHGRDRRAGDPLHPDGEGDGRQHRHRLGDERRAAAVGATAIRCASSCPAGSAPPPRNGFRR